MHSSYSITCFIFGWLNRFSVLPVFGVTCLLQVVQTTVVCSIYFVCDRTIFGWQVLRVLILEVVPAHIFPFFRHVGRRVVVSAGAQLRKMKCKRNKVLYENFEVVKKKSIMQWTHDWRFPQLVWLLPSVSHKLQGHHLFSLQRSSWLLKMFHKQLAHVRVFSCLRHWL